jgi:hypothetical protein
MKKGADVADDEDDDAVRTSVSQDRVTATLYTEELFLRMQYKHVYCVALFTYHTGQNVGGGNTESQHETFYSPRWVSHLPTGPSCDLQGFQ